ncbi:MAG: hypothetical protein FWD60_04615, partial [Candidatus Azobacteroides sp.]|nr:hypothetical protein [Candidatus Azobacteroides sp.]
IKCGTEFTTREKSVTLYSFKSVEYIITQKGTQENKPILRPLSDLYRTITHNGKEIVPIVELAKISFPNCEWEKNKNIDSAESKNGTFFYDYYKGFYYRYKGGISDVYNQYQLFDYLHELKIDYRGLIESGLAVSVYDLEDNPYK